MADYLAGFYPEWVDKEENPRQIILDLGKMITNRIPVKLGFQKLNKYDPEYWGLATLLTDEQAEVALKMGVRKPKTMADMVKLTGKSEEELVAMTGWLVTTLGGDGQRIRNAQGVDVHVPAIPCDGVKDPTGAGDSHRAGLLKGLVCGLEMPEAAKLGAVSACYAIEQLGTQEHHFSKDEFRKRYEASFGPLPITL